MKNKAYNIINQFNNKTIMQTKSNTTILSNLLKALLMPGQDTFTMSDEDIDLVNALPPFDFYDFDHEPVIHEFCFDPENGLISYILPEDKTEELYQERITYDPIITTRIIKVYPMI